MQTIELILALIIMAFIMEIIDSSLGMMYDTLLSQVLIGYGFERMQIPMSYRRGNERV